MKKVFFLLTLFVAFGFAAAQAQSCSGAAAKSSCSSMKACCASKAAKAASADATIERRLADDGTVSYVRKQTDTQGNVQFVSVQFDETSNAFVNVAPKSMTDSDKQGMVKKSCSAGASASGKSCCASGASAAKSCCAGKAAATTTPAPAQEQ